MPISFNKGQMVSVSNYGQKSDGPKEETRHYARIDHETGLVHIVSCRSSAPNWVWSRDKKVATLPIELFQEFARGLTLPTEGRNE